MAILSMPWLLKR